MGRRVRVVGGSKPESQAVYYSTHEVARLLNVSPTTVQSMVDSGQLKAWRTTGGHRRISAQTVEAVLRQAAAPALPRLTSNLRVLIIEDDKAQSKLLSSKIAAWRLPVDVVVVDDGLDALVRVGKEPPDVLIADTSMPKVDGLELIRRLRTQDELRGMEIVVITNLDGTALEKRGGIPPGVTLFRKPVGFEELKGFIRACVSRRTAVSVA